MTHFTIFISPSNNLPPADTLDFLYKRAGFHILAYVNDVSAKAISFGITKGEKLTAILAVDIMPLDTAGEIENPRIINIQRELRKTQNRQQYIAISKCQQFAKKLAKFLLPASEYKNIFSTLEHLEAEYKTNAAVTTILTNGSYNKAEVICKNKIYKIKKTFRCWQPSCLEREIKAREALSHLHEISPIEEVTKNSITLPFYKSSYTWEKIALLHIPYITQKKFLRRCTKYGKVAGA
ncbi:hypothetical protein NQX30_01315 [Candidatus Persebacteraceae bacterium Df01]|jgi:hypothetical protein|uniref:Uncharacterized protein n=1 Tax=Candidatus Doriopsillibacter californiensis TaxID=2970740 RepID=A0ABT7QK00_9GAMM|nr:hypothetical protein [Candidatus Persebacteraceae bacterium Df01]